MCAEMSSNEELGRDSGATVKEMLRLEHPDATDQELTTMARLIEVYNGLPPRLQVKLQEFMSLMISNNERAMNLGRKAADGEISIRQLLEAL